MELEKIEEQIIYDALVRHDGKSLCPDWDSGKQDKLTNALDSLRFIIYMKKETNGHEG